MALLPLAALGGMLRGGKKETQAETPRGGKQVAEKITGKKKSQSDATKTKGGALVPLSQIVGKQKTSVSKRSEDDVEVVALAIQHKTLRVKDILKGSFVLDKMRSNEELKEHKKAKREGEESELEAAAQKNKGKGKFGFPIPGAKKVKSIWNNLLDFFSTVLWGMTAVQLIEHSDLIGKWLPKIGKWADWLIEGGIGFIDRLVDGIDKGYSFTDWLAHEGSHHFGGTSEESKEKWRKQFVEFGESLKTVFNLVLALGAAATAAAAASVIRNFGKGKPVPKGKGPRGPGSHSGPRKPGSAPRTTGSTRLSRGWSKINRFFRRNITRGSNTFTRTLSKLKPFNFKVSKGSNVLSRNLSKLKPINTRVTVGSGGVKSLLNPKNFATGIRTLGIGIVVDWAATSLFENFVFKPMETASRNRRNEKLDKRIEEKGLEYVINKNKELIAEASAVQPLNWWQNALTLGFGNAAGGYDTAQMKLKILMEDLKYIQEKYGTSVLGEENPIIKSNKTININNKSEDTKNKINAENLLGRKRYSQEEYDKMSADYKANPTSSGARNVNRYARKLQAQNEAEFGGTGYPITIGDKTYQPGDEGYLEAIKSVMAETYHKGGLVPGTGERIAKLLGGEIVIDTDSAGPAKNMLLAINKASTYEGIIDAIKKFAPYDAMVPDTITIPRTTFNNTRSQDSPKEVHVLPIFGSGVDVDSFMHLYKGS